MNISEQTGRKIFAIIAILFFCVVAMTLIIAVVS